VDDHRERTHREIEAVSQEEYEPRRYGATDSAEGSVDTTRHLVERLSDRQGGEADGEEPDVRDDVREGADPVESRRDQIGESLPYSNKEVGAALLLTEDNDRRKTTNDHR
jgi:hypothetical protein